jgi:hypothetical protein
MRRCIHRGGEASCSHRKLPAVLERRSESDSAAAPNAAPAKIPLPLEPAKRFILAEAQRKRAVAPMVVRHSPAPVVAGRSRDRPAPAAPYSRRRGPDRRTPAGMPSSIRVHGSGLDDTSLAVTRSHPAAGNSHRVRPRYERPRWDLADCEACRTMPRAFAPVKPRTAHGPVCRIC